MVRLFFFAAAFFLAAGNGYWGVDSEHRPPREGGRYKR